MLEAFKFCGSGGSGDDFDQGVGGSKIKESAQDEIWVDFVPDKLMSEIRAFGEAGRRDIKEKGSLTFPPGENFGPGETCPYMGNDLGLVNSVDQMAGFSKGSFEFERGAHELVQSCEGGAEMGHAKGWSGGGRRPSP